MTEQRVIAIAAATRTAPATPAPAPTPMHLQLPDQPSANEYVDAVRLDPLSERTLPRTQPRPLQTERQEVADGGCHVSGGGTQQREEEPLEEGGRFIERRRRLSQRLGLVLILRLIRRLRLRLD